MTKNPAPNKDQPLYSRSAVSLDTVRAQLGTAYDRFGPGSRSRHAEMLRSISQPEGVEIEIERSVEDHWIVTVCTANRLGALSIVAGLFSALRLDIVRADVFTLHFPEPADASQRAQRVRRGRPRQRLSAPAGPPTTMILDIFEVRVPDGGADEGFWSQLRHDLASLMADLVEKGLDNVREQIIDRISPALQPAEGWTEQPLSTAIEVTNDPSLHYTVLVVRSRDTAGFLFAFANALAMTRVNIERAEIDTVEGEVRDVFWLTDARGRKITDKRRIQELRFATALIKHFTDLLPQSPNPAQALRQFHALTQQVLSRDDWTLELRNLESPEVLETLIQLLGSSRFLWEDFLRMQYDNLFPVLVDVPTLDDRKGKELLVGTLDAQLVEQPNHEDRVATLNKFKDREMFRIDLRHITERVEFRDFSEELTELAEVVVAKAAEISSRSLDERYGAPLLEDGRPCEWCVCALGKAGGHELGFGSDVELVFVYEDQGITSGADGIENSAYFGELVQEFTRTVIARQEGVFEIDMRLRPFGNAGALASSLSGFNDYYSPDGTARQFERLALVKLRPIAGDRALGAGVAEARDEFVYAASPIDVENILHLRQRQASELVPSGAVSAKYSEGGLVDLEYFVQTHQISAGRTDSTVRVTGTLDAIERLAEGDHLSRKQATEIAYAYRFMRRLIDALRVVRGNAKDLTIPEMNSRQSRYLAQRLGFESSAELHEAVGEQMNVARDLWKGEIPV